jgi:8-amino-3,8-dideoxy-alpha-D-manno-octulosonate transaminase
MNKINQPVYPGAMFMGDEELRAASDVINSKSLFRYYGYNKPGKVLSFEKMLAKYINSRFALAVNSGTSALKLALAALNIKQGDEVILPGYSFLASLIPVLSLQAIPIFVDIDETLNINPSQITKVISSKTRAIICVHIAGNPCNMVSLINISRKHKIPLVEDCAQSIGASYQRRKVGSFGIFGVYSLQQTKIITCGEGGALTTNNKDLYEKAVKLHDLGGWRNIHKGNPLIGENYRMGELCGAVALEQLKKIDKIINALRKNKAYLKHKLAKLPIRFRKISDEMGDNCIKLIFYVNKRERFIHKCKKLDLNLSKLTDADLIYRDIRLSQKNKPLKKANYLTEKNICISINPFWQQRDMDKIVDIIEIAIR